MYIISLSDVPQMWFFVIAVLLIIVLIAELMGYVYHVRVMNFARHKRYFNSKVDSVWIEKFMLNTMNKEELTAWISNSISYNCSNDHKYYNEVPLDKVPKNKMIKWVCYYLYFKS